MLHTIVNMLRQAVPELYAVDWRKVTQDYNVAVMGQLAELMQGEQDRFIWMLRLMRRQIIIEAENDVNVDIQFEALDSAMVTIMQRRFHRSYLDWVKVREMPVPEFCAAFGLPAPPRPKEGEPLVGDMEELQRRFGQHRATLADAFASELIDDQGPLNLIGILMASAVAARRVDVTESRPAFVQRVHDEHPQFFDSSRTVAKVTAAVNDLFEKSGSSLLQVKDTDSLRRFVYSLYTQPGKQEKMWELAFNLFKMLK